VRILRIDGVRNWIERRCGGALRGTVLGAIAAGVAVVAIVWPFGSESESASQPAGWTTYTDHRHGFRVTFPSSWRRAPRPLDPMLSNPKEILSLGSGPLPVGGGGDCHLFPAKAMAAMGPRDVLVSLKEDLADRVGGALRGTPPRPRHFGIVYRPRTHGRLQRAEHYGEMNRPGEIRSENLSEHAAWTEILFRDRERSFRVVVAIGSQASARARQDVRHTLDSLRFRPTSG
jgi:hypothetical protein